MYILNHEGDVRQEGVLFDNSIGILAADVLALGACDVRVFPKRIESLNAVLTVVDEADMPPTEDMANVVPLP